MPRYGLMLDLNQIIVVEAALKSLGKLTMGETSAIIESITPDLETIRRLAEQDARDLAAARAQREVAA